MHYLTVLKFRNLKSKLGPNRGVSRGWFLLQTVGDNLFSCLLQLLEAACLPWLPPPSQSQQQQNQANTTRGGNHFGVAGVFTHVMVSITVGRGGSGPWFLVWATESCPSLRQETKWEKGLNENRS